MKASASIQNSSRSRAVRRQREHRPRSHSARTTSRSKRTWSVWVGVKAVKSWLPASALGAALEQARLDRLRPEQDEPALERVWARRADRTR